jgi:hypothetical protein
MLKSRMGGFLCRPEAYPSQEEHGTCGNVYFALTFNVNVLMYSVRS